MGPILTVEPDVAFARNCNIYVVAAFKVTAQNKNIEQEKLAKLKRKSSRLVQCVQLCYISCCVCGHANLIKPDHLWAKTY